MDMAFLNNLTIPTALIISSLIIGYSILENGRSSRFQLTTLNPGLFIKINSSNGNVELCKIERKEGNYLSTICDESIKGYWSIQIVSWVINFHVAIAVLLI